LGDAIIAATAVVHAQTLATRNTDDFAWIPGLRLWNPLADPTHPDSTK
jgi:predicted nucleic acid-binding protein